MDLHELAAMSQGIAKEYLTPHKVFPYENINNYEMISKRCYTNAAQVVILEPERYNYCVGVGVVLGGVPIEHAYLFDKESKLHLDPTLNVQDGSTYFLMKTYTADELLDYMEHNENIPPSNHEVKQAIQLDIRRERVAARNNAFEHK